MSTDATRSTWMLSKKQVTSLERLFLLSCADRAGENGICWPSIKRLCADTSMDRKTVIDVRQSVIDKKFLEYTGEYQGRTKRVPIMRLTYIQSRCNDIHNSPENGTVSEKPNDPENGTINDPENGTIKQYRKRDTESKRENLKEESKKPSIVSQKKSLSISFEEASKNNNHGITEEWFNEWKAARKKPITQRVWNKTTAVMDELCTKGITGKESFEIMLDKQWEGMEARYYDGELNYRKNGYGAKKMAKGDALSNFLYNDNKQGNTYDQHGNNVDPFRRPRTN